MPYDWSAYVTGTLAALAMVATAALLGWFAARLILHAARSRADPPDRTGSLGPSGPA